MDNIGILKRPVVLQSGPVLVNKLSYSISHKFKQQFRSQFLKIIIPVFGGDDLPSDWHCLTKVIAGFGNLLTEFTGNFQAGILFGSQ